MNKIWRDEWQMLAALLAAYIVWGLATTLVAMVSVTLAIVLAGLAAALHSSLNHEVLHGHPTRFEGLNAALVFPSLSLFIPYLRFRDTHLAHHIDENLTDPYDDPESNFMDPDIWLMIPDGVQALLHFNNTLLGRMLIGPVISQYAFMWADYLAIRAGDRRVLQGWLWHIPALGLIVWWAVAVGQMPGWAYLAQAYLAMSLLKIRTFLEHRAHKDAPARTVLIEHGGWLGLLFLNNSYHIVHHTHPKEPWHKMPEIYAADKEKYLGLNQGYAYHSYGEIFRRYLFKAKDPVPHPLWSKDA